MIGNPLLLGDEGYQIQRSVRTRGAYPTSPSYFNRTAGTPTNNLKWTFSLWVKRGVLSVGQHLLNGGTGTSASEDYLHFLGTNKLSFYQGNGTTTVIATNAVFRDPSAWYHIVLVYDSAQATSTNRLFIYVNGVSQSFSSATYPTLNQTTNINASGLLQRISSRTYLADEGFDGYLAEVNFIDGQALTPSSFGAINATTGVWSATKYAGTYGTNGFYLNFTDNSAATATTIGKDYSGNGNNWTPNNISVTAGATYDSMLDAPLGAGGGERGNYAVLNPIEAPSASVVSNGNLQVVLAATSTSVTPSTLGVTNGKWYSEFTFSATASGNAVAVGVGPAETYQPSIFSVGVNYFAFDGTKTVSGVNTSYGATWTTGDIIGIALDVDGGTITFYKNNTSQGAITLPASTSGWKICVQNGGGSSTKTMIANFGQRPFSYTPPTGFKALHTGNFGAPVIALPAQNMAATTYTGTGSAITVSNAVNGVSMQPDFIWIKPRSIAGSHGLFDSVRGFSKSVRSNDTRAEDTSPANTDLTAFNSNGFSVGPSNYIDTSTSGATVVAWQWKAGGTAVSNTAGSITSSVSANVSAGFSVVTYTGNGTNGATVGHGLGAVPSMIIIKVRNAADNWPVYHKSLGNTDAVFLNLTTATQALAYWNSTTPSSTVFTLGSNLIVNKSSDTFVAYCFAPVAGYSAFGSYTGNGSADGVFIYTGFKPLFILVKISSTTSSWLILDSARNTYNVVENRLFPEGSYAEDTSGRCDFVSNGFKWRGTNLGNTADTYIYMAFAESPFKNSLAR